MRTIVSSAVVAIVLAIAAGYALDLTAQKTAYEANTTGGVRLADPGHNLVGPDWYAPQGG
jgi:hypothetical protein